MASVMQRQLDDGLYVRPKSVLYTNTVKTVTKQFVPSFVKPSHFLVRIAGLQRPERGYSGSTSTGA